MSRLLKSSLVIASTLCLSIGFATAADHPHDKDEKSKPSVTTEPVVEFEEDLNAHFERHAKRLREALDSTKGTKNRIIFKELNADDSAALAGDKTQTTKRIDIIESPEELRKAARSIQNMLAESGILENLADVVIELAEDIEIEETGDGMSFSFGDTRIVGFSVNERDETLSIETMGNNTTIEKETFIENGKTRTRIVIETDSDDVDFDIVPKAKKPRGGVEF